MAVLLDVTRSVSRSAIRQPTGIDRVETAYIEHFLNQAEPCWFLAKVPGGHYLLDPANARLLASLLRDHAKIFRPDLLAVWSLGRNRRRLMVESAVRTLGKNLVFAKRGELAGAAFYCVGHSDLGSKVLSAVRKLTSGPLCAMLHDTIPLDFPEFCSDTTAARFPAQLRAMAQFDLVICNSRDTEQRAAFWAHKFGVKLATQAVHLGIEKLPQLQRRPAKPARFLMLGTMEPRKNHDLLLEVWQEFHAKLPAGQIPHLDIVGRRGWKSAGLFARLDAARAAGWPVHEHGALSDTKVRAMMAESAALLFPSLAEGFGLPVLEAMQAGLPVICSDLPAMRETAGNGALYLDPRDADSWAQAIIGQQEPNAQHRNAANLPTWDRHFSEVFRHVRDLAANREPH